MIKGRISNQEITYNEIACVLAYYRSLLRFKKIYKQSKEIQDIVKDTIN